MPITWTTFTRRTQDPKLAFVEHLLTKAGISHKRDGASFHAPILQVPEGDLAAAEAIMQQGARGHLGVGIHPRTTVDDLPDDFIRFYVGEKRPGPAFDECEAHWNWKPSDWIRPCIVYEVTLVGPDSRKVLGDRASRKDAELLGGWEKLQAEINNPGQTFSYEVKEEYEGCGECQDCLDAFEDPNDYKGMGWVGANGQP